MIIIVVVIDMIYHFIYLFIQFSFFFSFFCNRLKQILLDDSEMHFYIVKHFVSCIEDDVPDTAWYKWIIINLIKAGDFFVLS